jgi:Asp-tRNA(Asn)/Glu-tRNA(Gln) amidotransferase A subunit family amidase
MTLNLRSTKRQTLGFDPHQARSMTDGADDNPAMPDALDVAAQQDVYFAANRRLIGPLPVVVLAIKDQYDTFDMRTTAGMDAAYANDRPPRDATFVKRLRDAGAILIAKANLGEMGTPNSRSSFGGPFCNPYDTEGSTIVAPIPLGIMFWGRPFSEPTLLKIASACEAATKHRVPPPDFGPVAER